MERQLGVRLLNRNSRGVSLTEIGALYLERCKLVLRELESADNLVSGRLGNVKGTLRIGVSMTFGRRVVAPLLIDFLERHPEVDIDLNCDDRYVDIVSHGLDLAIRLGKLADSSLGCRWVGASPWAMVASPGYLAVHGAPAKPADLAAHRCLIYSTVQGDDVWRLQDVRGVEAAVDVGGRLKSNNLSILFDAACAGMGVAILPRYLAAPAIQSGALLPVLADCPLPSQEINVVFPSPRFVPTHALALTSFLQRSFQGDWWERAKASPLKARRAGAERANHSLEE